MEEIYLGVIMGIEYYVYGCNNRLIDDFGKARIYSRLKKQIKRMTWRKDRWFVHLFNNMAEPAIDNKDNRGFGIAMYDLQIHVYEAYRDLKRGDVLPLDTIVDMIDKMFLDIYKGLI